MNSKKAAISRLFQILEMCDIHLERMEYAKKRLDDFFPLDKQSYKSLDDSDVTLINQMIKKDVTIIGNIYTNLRKYLLSRFQA